MMKMSDFGEVIELRGQLNNIRMIRNKIANQDHVRMWISPPSGTDMFMYASNKSLMELLKAEEANIVDRLQELEVSVDD